MLMDQCFAELKPILIMTTHFRIKCPAKQSSFIYYLDSGSKGGYTVSHQVYYLEILFQSLSSWDQEENNSFICTWVYTKSARSLGSFYSQVKTQSCSDKTKGLLMLGNYPDYFELVSAKCILQFQVTVFKAGTQMLAHRGPDALLRTEPAGRALGDHVSWCDQVCHCRAGLGWAVLAI